MVARDGYEMNANVQDNQYYNPYSQNQVFWLSFEAVSTVTR